MNLDRHPYFEPWTDPGTGVRSYILTERVAPLQKAFYFVNASISPDESVLWFEAAFPPAPYKFLTDPGTLLTRPAETFPGLALDV
jgi:hypothetical protein